MDFDLPTGISVLERTPQTLWSMLAGLPPGWTEANEGPDTWSPHDVIAHLVHGERNIWIARARTILERGRDSPFTPVDQTAMFRESQGKSLAELLDEFSRLRLENLETVAGWKLTDEKLALQGEHPGLGPVTLRQLLATWVAHDLGHIVQISRVMARQYRDAVGPWHAYLAVMGPR